MVGCVFSQLNIRSSTFLAVEKASAFSTAKNVELLGLYPIPKTQNQISIHLCVYCIITIVPLNHVSDANSFE